ncbi:MAG: hypothetical protein J6S20_00205 [Paludibacteraceae bacterium]|nr:hypothetical protein [Paludibacteraceae bacterium]
MSIEELQSRTTVNIQEKSNLIWAIADKLVGDTISVAPLFVYSLSLV